MAITRTAWIDDDGTGTTGTIINNAEKTILYDQIDGAIGAGWTSFTPFWGALSGTAPTTGNAILVSRFLRQGKTIQFIYCLSTGTTTTYGSAGGIWSFGLPAAVQVPAGVPSAPMAFSAAIMNAAGSGFPPSIAYPAATPDSFYLIHATGGIIGATIPFTWAANCKLVIRGTYEEP